MSRLIEPSRVWPMCAAVAALLFTLYLPSLRGSFLYDDHWFIVRNPAVRSAQTPITSFFTEPATTAAPGSGLSTDVFRPVTTLSFWLDARLWQGRTTGYHVENLLLHLGVGWLLFRIFLALGLAWRPAAAGAVLFLIHPVQTQSVAWISQRSTVLSAVFLFASLLTLMAQPLGRGRLFVGAALAGGALLSKESAVLAPALLLLLLAARGDVPWRQRLMRVGVLGILSLEFLLWRSHMLPHLSQYGGGPRRFGLDAALGLMSVPLYVGKALAPVRLRASYAYPGMDATLVLGGAALLVMLVVAVWGSWRYGSRQVAAGFGWFLVGLMPFLQIIPVRAYFADRFLYVPLAGLCWVAGVALARWPRIWLVWAGVGLAFCAWTAQAAKAWHSERALWTAAVRAEPGNGFAHACLAQTMSDPEDARRHYMAAVRYSGEGEIQSAALNNLSFIAYSRGRFREAFAWATLARRGSQNRQAEENWERAREALRKGRA